MTGQREEPILSQRRVRPSIAALLSLLGWGLGLYYARRSRAAVIMAAMSTVFGVVLGGAGILFLYLNGPVSDVWGIEVGGIADYFFLIISIFIGMGVWVFVARGPKLVSKSGPNRIFGYVAIWGAPVLASVLIALFARFLIAQPFHMPAASMSPTLKVGDFFVIEKSSYGYSPHSFAPFDALFPRGRINTKLPKRGDVVVFRNSKDGLKDYVKRLVGVPGDRIQFSNGRLYINDELIKRTLFSESKVDCFGRSEGVAYRETLPNGMSYVVQECSGDNGPLDNVGPYIVPEGHYFMLGDNRDMSQDSRVTSAVGFIPFDHIVGRVKVKETP